MKLYATPLSHFSRKVRFLFDYYSIPYESIDVGNVAEGKFEKFGNNPLSRVPVLEDGENWLIESDYIAEYLAQKFDPLDSLEVKSKNIFDLNARAILNGIMAEEVKVLIAKRMQVPIESYDYFDRAIEAMRGGLDWLENNSEKFSASSPKYRELHLVCLFEHIAYYDLIPLNQYQKLNRVVAEVSSLAWVKKSAPYILKPR